jgi:ferric enterobactin receptor
MAVTLPAAAQSGGGGETTLQEVRVLGTAEEELKQAPGVSVITAQDLEKRPPANDLSEIIRTMPGVNLTGNTSSGAYGNNRQIDLRGMGPENTLIMIDGKPVTSRNSTRMGRNGERNSRGDSNWVPAEAIESIEVLRGPAAARYGSGAAGGVVNIITKRPSEKLTGSVSLYALQPEDRDESDTKRTSFHLAGPLSEKFSFRLYGNVNKTNADSPSLNADASGTSVTSTTVPPAGREGVRNRDLNGLVRWDITQGHIIEFEGGFSRQGNIYAGERIIGTGTAVLSTLANDGAETNTMYRRTGSITHRGNYGEGRTSKVLFSYEGTTNSRLNEQMTGGVDGTIASPSARSTSELKNYFLSGEYNTPLKLGNLSSVLTVGAEYTKQKLHDPWSISAFTSNTGVANNGKADSHMESLFVEDNIEITQNFILTPGLRYDHHDEFGSNWSPSLNASYNLSSAWTLKSGIARAFKAPNLYQINPNYMYRTNGNGCPVGYATSNAPPTGCQILGNADLNPEISVNKELGIAYAARGWASGLTYFHNDYKNKIVSDMSDQPEQSWAGLGVDHVFKWFNSGKAIVRGVEGYLNIPILGHEGDVLKWSNNLTWMDKNQNKKTHQPLSVIPKYTLNSTLDWQPTEKLSFQLHSTFYGKQKPRTRDMSGGYSTTTNKAGTTSYPNALEERKAYHIYSLSGSYAFTKNVNLRFGINNLADKRLYREDSQTAQGAATYNEPGRAYYATLTTSF